MPASTLGLCLILTFADTLIDRGAGNASQRSSSLSECGGLRLPACCVLRLATPTHVLYFFRAAKSLAAAGRGAKPAAACTQLLLLFRGTGILDPLCLFCVSPAINHTLLLGTLHITSCKALHLLPRSSLPANLSHHLRCRRHSQRPVLNPCVSAATYCRCRPLSDQHGMVR